ncbi:hypothetical protein BJ684DRAFT_14625 [Piptocephalis cylindrospora]|uniref:Uncharacterized protein n=1 Tax=Piptocephalis cylindrospora TaxID=1907219 RepID=A0A4P9Y7N3_9FUNG|nr:hypothetical protein BJ684DRAFT_14625 [Piptocephalis cylindrospora]|eukprot:RKP15098.1 hypothetical protein BJ684DRAFT_14625 [Piptocephalis cylindrospora]
MSPPTSYTTALESDESETEQLMHLDLEEDDPEDVLDLGASFPPDLALPSGVHTAKQLVDKMVMSPVDAEQGSGPSFVLDGISLPSDKEARNTNDDGKVIMDEDNVPKARSSSRRGRAPDRFTPSTALPTKAVKIARIDKTMKDAVEKASCHREKTKSSLSTSILETLVREKREATQKISGRVMDWTTEGSEEVSVGHLLREDPYVVGLGQDGPVDMEASFTQGSRGSHESKDEPGSSHEPDKQSLLAKPLLSPKSIFSPARIPYSHPSLAFTLPLSPGRKTPKVEYFTRKVIEASRSTEAIRSLAKDSRHHKDQSLDWRISQGWEYPAPLGDWLIRLVCYSQETIVVEWALEGLKSLIKTERREENQRLDGEMGIEKENIMGEREADEDEKEAEVIVVEMPRKTIIGEAEDLLYDLLVSLGALPPASVFDVKGKSSAWGRQSIPRRTDGTHEDKKEEPRIKLTKRLGYVLDIVFSSASLALNIQGTFSWTKPFEGKEKKLLRMSRGMLILMHLRMDPISEPHLIAIQKIASLWIAQAKELDGMGWMVEWLQRHLLYSCVETEIEEEGDEARRSRLRVYAVVLDVLSPLSTVSSLMRRWFSWMGLQEELVHARGASEPQGICPLDGDPVKAQAAFPSSTKSTYGWLEKILQDYLGKVPTEDTDYLWLEAVVRLVDGILSPSSGKLNESEWTVDAQSSSLSRIIGSLRRLDGAIHLQQRRLTLPGPTKQSALPSPASTEETEEGKADQTLASILPRDTRSVVDQLPSVWAGMV